MKLLRLTLSEAAAADIVEQADWYEQQSGPSAGEALGESGYVRGAADYGSPSGGRSQ